MVGHSLPHVEDRDLTHVSELAVSDGEEHVARSIGKEAAGLGAELSTDDRVPGRLLGRQEVYSRIGAEPYIVRTIRDGYRLEFDSEPPPSLLPNNRSARERPDFVLAELARLEKLGCILKVNDRPRVVNPMSVVYSNKWRLVLDGSRNLNPYCTARKARLEDLSHIASTVKKFDFMVVNDHDSGYWHVPVAEEHWKYLGIHVVDEAGKTTYYVWRVLVLGLRDAAYIYTRINRPIMAALRRKGIRSLIYIDDNLTVGKSLKDCLKAERVVIELFQECGWVFKAEKRSGEPAQVCRFLGLVIDTRDLTFNIPKDKFAKIQNVISEVRAQSRVPVKVLAKLVGMLQSVRLATGPIVAVLTRSLYHVVDEAPRWSSRVKLSSLASAEVEWWKENLEKVSKYPISESSSTTPVNYETASDASGVGHYSYVLGNSRASLASRAFTEVERRQSSTWRELAAFHETWTCPEVLQRFAGCRIAHYTDSQAMASIVSKGSRNVRLQPMVVEAVLALRDAGIVMEAVWLSREAGVIEYADRGSRDFHPDDISLDFDSMAKIHNSFGVFDIDTFATDSNKKAVRFYSRMDVPGSSGTNFFHQSLDPRDSHFCFPPPSMLTSALRHFERCQVSAVMVLPVWAGSSFYSTFWPDGTHAADFVHKMEFVNPYFECGPLVKGSSMKGFKPYRTAVLKVDFTKPPRKTKTKMSCLSDGCSECTN